jgi:S1-C subfamily serine protease
MPSKARFRFLCAVACVAIGASLAGCATPGVNAPMPTDPASLRALAERGNPIAANELGVLYSNGTKVPQDFAEAQKWYQFASDHGNPAGAFNIGIAYERGQSVPRNPAEAIKWFHIAADRNFAPAKFVLAAMYRTGKDVPRDDVESTRLANSAAVQGLPAAQGFLAALYLDGSGVPDDDSLAYEWASLAASKMTGVPGTLASKIRDEAAKGLSPAELTAAQAATAAWKPGSDLVSLFPPGSPPRPPRLRGSGSGFVIGKGGEIATDFHVVPNCRQIKVIDPAGKFDIESHIVADDRGNDLAILAGGGFGTRLKLRTIPAEIGESINVYGFPLGAVLSTSGNLTAGSVSAATGFQGNVKAFQMTTPVQAGSSGGPVVDDGGALVGIVAAKLNALSIAAATGDLAQNVNFAWRAGLLKSLLDQKAIAYDTAAKSGSRSGVDLGELLQKATVKIECWR